MRHAFILTSNRNSRKFRPYRKANSTSSALSSPHPPHESQSEGVLIGSRQDALQHRRQMAMLEGTIGLGLGPTGGAPGHAGGRARRCARADACAPGC